MPRRSPPPERLGCEAALTDTDLIALRDQASTLGVAPDGWHLVPSMATLWGTIATLRLAEKLRELHGLSQEQAQAWAAEKLSLSAETIRTRLKRWPKHAHGLRLGSS